MVERLGAESYVHLGPDHRRMLVLRQEGSLDDGDGVRLTFGPATDRAWHLFADDGAALPAAGELSSTVGFPPRKDILR